MEAAIRRGWIQSTLDRAQGELDHIDRLLAIVGPAQGRKLRNRRYLIELRRDEAAAALDNLKKRSTWALTPV